jgi:hypothetical protein
MADPIVPVPVPATDDSAAFIAATVKHQVAQIKAEMDAKYEALLAARPAADKPAGTPTGADDVAQLKAQLKAMQDQSYAERKASREGKAFQDLRSELAGKVRPEGVEWLAKHIMHADKRVQVADDGAITFKHGEADYNLREGVAAYLKSPEAAMFIPAPNGTAQRPGARVPARTTVTGAPPADETPMAKTLRLLAGAKAAS